jgi:anhydro-N-acetylmuramic acid kinase
MTGTSCDGLDASCVEFQGSGFEVLWSESAPYPEKLRTRVLHAQKPGTKETTLFWLELDRDLGKFYGETLSKFITLHPKERPDAIANHGQTLAHFPDQSVTLQLGDPSKIATATELTVISSFRNGDMAAGGQGAPLLPLFHQIIAEKLDPDCEGIAIHNLGGISNLTYISPSREVMAFDTGPCNIWIDFAATQATRGKQKFDRDGKLAIRGEVDSKACDKILKMAYFSKKPPKSTGRDDFPFELILKATRDRNESMVATATAITVESIVHAYENFILRKKLPLRKIYFCGGGTKNPALMNGLKNWLPEIEMQDLSEAGLDAQYIESLGFALFGYMTLKGRPIGGPWTGAQGFGPPGHIIPGKNWAKISSI